nr:immunoglobulin heavy chain junction region [Mus musculus]
CASPYDYDEGFAYW